MANVKYVLSVGLLDKDTRKQEVTEEQAKELIFNTCGDCTVYKAEGAWTYEDGQSARENTLRVELLFKAESEIRNMCNVLKQELNQEAIAVTPIVDNSFLI